LILTAFHRSAGKEPNQIRFRTYDPSIPINEASPPTESRTQNRGFESVSVEF
jgi:hypothetical protein